MSPPTNNSSPGPRLAIVVADDFGVSPGVNRGVIEAYEAGVVTTASLLANLPGFEDAVERARARPGLAVGFHLNLTFGRPVSPAEEVRSLVDAEGAFWRFPAWLRRWASGRIDPDHVRRECMAQARRIADAGLAMGHGDAHQLLDALPVVRRALAETLRAFGVPAVRPLRERPRLADLRALNLPGPAWAAWPKRIAKFAGMRMLSAGSTAAYRRAGLWTPERCVGLFIGGGQDLNGYLRLFRSLPAGVSEVCAHPAYVDEGLRATPFKFVAARETELRALTHPALRRVIEQEGIELSTYPSCAARFGDVRE